ncbi:TfoX/Sxy family transcriptional regulator of competence genes [Aeromicrobium panaciterrae]|uniref:TfoX/Sxy family transcriptional regulator of competence genes n=1 Tax=Aeromicrobium panaciterrae TaxID=363861 RepID=A0ABU1UME7_9ACTN|nr:TfoX/Sxy family protein [Aeromicrobium panaciterrae]MDR7086351.1 TfoX/Sxy family transcriptional regulator of competence genes [Aeromicrobium panaciterrae]
MAYDEEIAARVRDRVGELAPYEEKKMFGGLAFMVNTHMACGMMQDGLMIRVGRDGHAAAITKGAHEMGFTGRPMRGMVLVPNEDCRDEVVESWVTEAVAFAMSESPKPPKKAKA